MLPALSDNGYSEQKFHQNNVRILIVAAFLFFEQLMYGFFIAGEGSLHQKIYIGSAILMFSFVLLSTLFLKKKIRVSGLGYKAYELSLGVAGMAVAVLRILVEQNEFFRVPTIYIAVLYGVAVIFVYNYYQSFTLYTLATVVAIVLIPRFHPDVLSSSYRADIISNGCIAWLVSALNYRNFTKDIRNKMVIQDQNEELVLKNKQIEKANRELSELSVRDALTGLFNRRKLEDELEETQAGAERYGTDFSVIIMDVDHFKQVNDNHGHEVGDRILRNIAAVFGDNIRETDYASRWGGEEFLILCPRTDLMEAAYLAERLREKISRAKYHDDISVTASFGVASWSEYSEVKKLLSVADKRLYLAKAGGRNRVVADSSFS